MRSLGVVAELELIQLRLELLNRLRLGLLGEIALQGLMKSFDFALGLRMTGRTILLLDAKVSESVFKGILSANKSGCVNKSVVSQCRLRRSESGDGFEEAFNNIRGPDWGVGGAGE